MHVEESTVFIVQACGGGGSRIYEKHPWGEHPIALNRKSDINSAGNPTQNGSINALKRVTDESAVAHIAFGG
jgi:hypothetical protein